MALSFRDATLADLPLIVDIYNSTIAGRMVTADLEPVSADSRLPWFHAHTPDRRPLWMVENEQGDILGWVSFQDFYGREAYNGTAEISIYLAPAARGKGVGKEALHYCIRNAPRFGIKTLLGFVFAHNEPSLKLFYQQGFEAWANMPNIAVLDGIERSLVILGKRIAP
ncbi:N-acetyltransferase family protein [Paraflavisolibacter sp. H34]|uniref:GNAT family N-acetyltransferase n=1 Tax=Huijunlia imazamoxiresistens TaxID=3127457 RepID=UPI003019CC88